MSRTNQGDFRAPSPWRAVLLSGAFGAILGVFFTSTWQVAVETAQVLAGLVQYPEQNPFFRYHVSAWSLIHQALALVLWIGLDERVLSIALSGALAAATFGGLTLCCHAISPRGDLAVLAPLVWFALFRDTNAYGVSYPLLLTGTHHTYGVMGRAVALWLIGLAAHQYSRPALFLMGLAPALHLTWGLYAATVTACGWLLTAREHRVVRRGGPWLMAGATVAMASFGLQRLWRHSLPHVQPSETEPLLRAFLTHWDGHRIPVSVLTPGTMLVASVVVCAALALWRSKNQQTSARMFYGIALVAGLTGLALLVLARFPHVVPAPLAVAMPGRFANLTLLLFPAMLLGTIGTLPRAAERVLLFAIVLYVVWNWLFDAFLSSDKYGWSLAHWKFLVPVLVLAATVRFQNSVHEIRHTTAPSIAAIAVVALGVLVYPMNRVEPLVFKSEDPVLSRARNGTGLIITGPGMELIQLRTRRPVLLNTGGLDQLPYVPESGPAMNEALEAVYGVSIGNPPDEVRKRRPGALPQNIAVDLFADRTLEQWQAIAERFSEGSVSVLVRPTHVLAFEPAVVSDQWRLYDIPPRNEEK